MSERSNGAANSHGAILFASKNAKCAEPFGRRELPSRRIGDARRVFSHCPGQNRPRHRGLPTPLADRCGLKEEIALRECRGWPGIERDIAHHPQGGP